ncbi:hypothetical protein BDN70DRAFT_875875 [Pholiota conissans]|uniref:C2H2-type domain-containing protein n=1 Tax=Pholiota conissans TaxID=109636 RepID=A0A9P5Z612_9AGAR|nr:hypothetical protein BDN70DRAFT_875875 [Pholiota conissans]
MSDSEVSQASISSPSQKFIPQEDDEETLWEVIEITAEKGNTYKVRWKGNDPKTMKPWPQSWVTKSDCTDDLVIEWKRKQKEKQKKSKSGRLSTSSKRTGRDSVSTVGRASTSKLPATPKSKDFRRSASTLTEKVTAKPKTKSGTLAAPIVLSDEDNDMPPPPKPKGTKRKLADATSANSSAHHPPEDAAVDVNINEKSVVQPKGRPKKKRKVEVEIVRPDPESEDASSFMPSHTHIQSSPEPAPRSKDHRRSKNHHAEKYKEALKRKSEESEEEADERMIEDALSQASPPPLPDDFDDIYATDPEAPPPPPPKPTRAPEPKSKGTGKGKEKAKHRESSTTPPPQVLSPIKFGPPSKRRSLANKEKIKTQFKPASKELPNGQSEPIHATTAQVATSSRTLPSPPPGAHDTSEKETLPEERSVAYYDFRYFEPILSPAALARLAEFDEEVMGIPRNTNSGPTTKVAELKPKADAKVQNNKEKSSELQRTNSMSETSRTNKGKGKAQEIEETPELVQKSSNTTAAAPNASKTVAKPKGDWDKPKSKPPSTATTTSKTNTIPHRPSPPPVDAYNSDIVPETDESQEVAKPPTRPTIAVAAKSLKSKSNSRSKTPPLEPEQPNASPKPKELRPIPVLSPSVFRPHLPPSSLPEDISEESSQRRPSSKVSGDEDDPPMSSIEQFESPEKKSSRPTMIMPPKRGGRTRAGSGNSSNGNIRPARESASDIWESDVVKRGLLIASAAKRKQNKETMQPKATLDEIIAKTRSRSGSNKSAQDVERTASKPTPIPEDDEDEDVDMADASTAVVPPASGPHASLEVALQELENAYVDLNGGMEETQEDVTLETIELPPAAPVEPLFLRDEEEESTQDILMDLQRAQQAMQRAMDDKMLGDGWGVLPTIPETTTPPLETGEPDAEPNLSAAQPIPAEVIPKAVVDKAAASDVPPTAPRDEPPPLRRSARSRSISVTTVPPPSRLNSKSKSTAPPPPPAQATLSNAITTPVPIASSNGKSVSAEPSPDNQSAATIASLEAALAAERAKLAQQDISLKEQQSRTAEVLKQQEEAAKQLSDLTAQYQLEKEGWENEKLQLTVQLDSANNGKIMADKDSEFFREQYAKASGFVTSVREENKDLEKRIKIAEEQTQTGVSLVKATFDLRIQTLEEDLKAWRRTAEFLIEKDIRTGNDEIRRRAAEEPELRALCQRQQELYTKAQEDISELEDELEGKRRECAEFESEIRSLRAEATKLHVELNEALFKLDQVGREGYGDESMDTTENGHEFVYSCKWRNGDHICREVFATISELEQHLVTRGGHLHSG